jgi:hypothetical protein
MIYNEPRLLANILATWLLLTCEEAFLSSFLHPRLLPFSPESVQIVVVLCDARAAQLSNVALETHADDFEVR